MKHSVIKLYCAAVLLFFFTSSQAQLVPPFNHRAQQATQLYGLSAQQLKSYEKALGDVLNKWNAVKTSTCSPSARKEAELKLQNELCTKVKAILPSQQYTLWHRNHRGNLTVRFYKEDLGMNNETFAKFRSLTNAYTEQKNQISSTDLVESERSERRAKAFQQYSNGVHNIVSKELADYLIYENRVTNIAKTLSKKYTIISETKAIRYAMLKIEHEEKIKRLEAQKTSKQQRKDAKQKLDASYEKSLQSLLTTEEYIACDKHRDKLTDKKMMKDYKMSEQQLAKYKELKKKLAMKELVIKKGYKDKEGRMTKLQAAKEDFEKEMEKSIGSGKYKRWKKNEQMKIQKK